jgi:hypothetical protein
MREVADHCSPRLFETSELNERMRQSQRLGNLGRELLGPMLAGIRSSVLEQPEIAVGVAKPKLFFASELFLSLARNVRIELEHSELGH